MRSDRLPPPTRLAPPMTLRSVTSGPRSSFQHSRMSWAGELTVIDLLAAWLVSLVVKPAWARRLACAGC